MARLADIEGIGAAYARKLTEINAVKKLVRQLPSVAQVSAWVDQAKTLPRVVTH